jgi:ferric-dicitrate binding protein FerR (iron transport regulator)
MTHTRALLPFLVAVLAGCTGEARPVAKPPPPPKTAPRSPAESDGLASGPTGFFRSKRFDLRIPFPDGAAFKIDDTRAPWLVARHEASRSTVVLRRWREADLVSHDICEAKARTLRALPSLDDAEIIETRSLAVPPDHDTTATAALVHAPARKDAAPPPLYGVILAFGGFAHDCFAYAFVTEAEGREAETIVAARLVRMMDGSLAAIDARSDLDPSLEREGRPRR